MKKKLVANKYSGFTLVELLVVISIMAIMGGVGFVSLQTSKSSTRLQAAQREVTATIKQAQSYALQGRMQPSTKVCGYGVRFTTATAYQLFYKTPTAGQTCVDGTNYGSFISVENSQLGNGVVLSNPVLANVAKTEIYFAIPFGKIFGPGTAIPFTSSTMTFQYSGANKSISINLAGQITEN